MFWASLKEEVGDEVFLRKAWVARSGGGKWGKKKGIGEGGIGLRKATNLVN